MKDKNSPTNARRKEIKVEISVNFTAESMSQRVRLPIFRLKG